MPHIKHALIRFRIIDRLIRNKYKPFPSKSELREACEESLYGSVDGANICDSTIEKDLFSMRMELDAPVKYSKKEGGYFYEDPDFSINDVPLTEDELSSISFAVKTLMQFKESNLFRQFGNAIDKIVDRVAVAGDQTIGDIIQFEAAISVGGNEFLSVLLEAIKASQLVNFNYTSFVTGITKRRTVLPLLLKEYRNRWYLVSFDQQKNDILTFGLDRMSDLELTQEKATMSIDFDAESYFKYSIGITSNKSEPIEIIFKANAISAKYILSQPFHHTQKIVKENSESTTFNMKVIMSEELTRNFLSYGDEIEIISPNHFRDAIKQKAEQMVKLYK
ncbi:MAG: WYL domain-containing protein [Bacteroidota bacterium]